MDFVVLFVFPVLRAFLQMGGLELLPRLAPWAVPCPRYLPARGGGWGPVLALGTRPGTGAVTVVTGGRRDPRLTREMDGGAGFPQLIISPCSGKAERFLPGKLCAIPQKSGLNKWG